MRVLTVGNMYPPHHLGGYELIWQSAVRHQRAAGHEVRVLATDWWSPGADPALEDTDVHRELCWYWSDHRFPRVGWRARLHLERHNAAVLERHLAEVAPDVVAWWAMGGMSLALIERVRRAGVPAIGVVGDEWMLYGPRVDAWTRQFWRLPGLAQVVERRTGIPCRLDLGPAATWLFMSESLRRKSLAAGWDPPRTAVVNPGVDRSFFSEAPTQPWAGRLLYLGRIDRRKGIAVAIKALPRLPSCTLTIVGQGDERHLEELRALARRLGVEGRTRFTTLPRSAVPAAYAEADALLFPVQWEEPWGLVPLEAMAVGTPVIATGTGGSGDYLSDGENCLLFRPRDDVAALAEAVARLADDDALRGRLRAGGLRTAARFDETSYNRTIEGWLRRVTS